MRMVHACRRNATSLTTCLENGLDLALESKFFQPTLMLEIRIEAINTCKDLIKTFQHQPGRPIHSVQASG